MSSRKLGLMVVATLCLFGSMSLAASGPAFAAGAPVVEDEWVSGVGNTTVTLAAKVNPTEGSTTYHFEYGTGSSYGASIPVSGASIGSGAQGLIVEQVVGGLQPGVAYHYRVVATNTSGVVNGSDNEFKTFSLSSTGTDSCPTADIRQEQFSSYLPDCRAYEMVSPVEKQGANITAGPSTTQSAANGEAVKFVAQKTFGGDGATEQYGAEYVSTRSDTGWNAHQIDPPQSSIGGFTEISSLYQSLSADLTTGVYFALSPVTSDHPDVAEVANLYLRRDVLGSTAGSYELLSDCTLCDATPLPPRAPVAHYKEIAFAGASADWNQVIFETVNNLTPETNGLDPGIQKLYEWDRGTLRLAGVMPDGKPAEGSAAGAGAGGNRQEGAGTFTDSAISSDGSRIIFTGEAVNTGIFGGGWNEGKGWPIAGNMYMRIDHRETVQLNVSERTTPDPLGSQPATFWGATADDSKVFFASPEMLTDDAPGENPENGDVYGQGPEYIYMYDVKAPAGKHLTLISGGYAVVGMSVDAEYIYVLSSSGLYVWHDGQLRYVTTGSPAFQPYPFLGDQWGQKGLSGYKNFRVSRDGKTAAFTSKDPGALAQLGFNSLHAPGGRCLEEEGEGTSQCVEVLVYDYDRDKLVCASCSPTGRAESDAGFSAIPQLDGAYEIPSGLTERHYLANALSENGRYVFFDTADALVAGDTNGRRDVYEYDTSAGETHLISSGTCACDSAFVDASPDGSNVFFTTPQPLVRVDDDVANDLYDARADGGIPAQNVAPPAPCEGDDCQGPAKAAPVFSLPSSATFAGVGNAPAPKVVVAVKPRSSTDTSKVRRALLACRKKWKRAPRKRAVCEANARKKQKAGKSRSGRLSHRVGR